jgi:hypothetical protein
MAERRGRGGPGRGQGRKRSPNPLKSLTVRLPSEQIELLRKIGGGNASEGVRRLLRAGEVAVVRRALLRAMLPEAGEQE